MACPGDGLPDRRAKLKLKDERVLVVEDEALVSMLVEDGLRDAGATVLGPATTVGDALRLVEAAAADGGLSAAVLDINLQGDTVTPVADRLAALGVPFLFATGYGEKCDTGGHRAAPVLSKPFSVRKCWSPPSRLWRPSGGAATRRMGLSQRNRRPEEQPPTAAVPCRRRPGIATRHDSLALDGTGGGCGARLRPRPPPPEPCLGAGRAVAPAPRGGN